MRRAVAALVLIIASFVAPGVATAQTGGGEVKWSGPTATLNGSLRVGDEIGGGGHGGSPGTPSVTVYSQVMSNYCFSIGPTCDFVRFACTAEGLTLGSWRLYRLADDLAPPDDSGTVVFYSTTTSGDLYYEYLQGNAKGWCMMPGSGSPSIPPAPTASEIWRAAETAGSGVVVQLRPEGLGLTGLRTPLWLEMSATSAQPIDLNIRGWSVQGSVWLDSVDWRIADAATDTVVASEGSSPVSAAGVALGSQSDPLAWFQFRTKGRYSVTGSAVWKASGTVSYQGRISRTFVFPDAALSTTYEYPVDELVGVLDRPGG